MIGTKATRVALLSIDVSFATLCNQEKKNHNQHGVGYDYSEPSTQNEGLQGKRAMKNKNYYRLD
jgi:hypothetical protein